MMKLALLSRSIDLNFLKPMLTQSMPTAEVSVWPDPTCLQAEIAVCWDPPRGIYAQMPNLRLVHSIAAGVDNIVAGQDLRGLPVCRVSDPTLAEGMWQFVLWAVLYFHRKFDQAFSGQRRREWLRPQQTPASASRVGIMGLGELGGLIAQRLPTMGYPVNGWARTPRALTGVTIYSGELGLHDFLAATDILVCLLPLTPQTRGILNRSNLARLPKGAALIHCGRGEQLIESDLLAALHSGQVRGAVVDVFEHEPLSADNPLWDHDGMVVTPHMATMATYDVVVRQVNDNVNRLVAGQPLLNKVDMEKGY